MSALSRLVRVSIALLFSLFLLSILATAGVAFYLLPQLPDSNSLRDVQLQVPLRIYSRTGDLIAEFGEKRRIPVTYRQIPDQLVKAFLAAEDDRFFEHPGVDYQGLVRAALALARTGEKRQGGSTITMQVARNFFLTGEKTYLRKLTEIMLALQIERDFSKQDILELYLNKIYMGHRAYGVAAAAQIYYRRELADLSLPQMAMIAGLPKAPSAYNPIANPARALQRRNYVLGRMRQLGYIDETAYRAAIAEPDDVSTGGQPVDLDAPYIAEMARAYALERFGEDVYNSGMRVYTTVDTRLQHAADQALRGALMEYDERHGWRGAERHLTLAGDDDTATLAKTVSAIPKVGGLSPALITGVSGRTAHALLGDGETIELAWQGLSWARRYVSASRTGAAPQQAGDILQAGDIVRVMRVEDQWHLSQIPVAQGALVSLSPADGSVLALTGGFDFYLSKFNRATQAERQPGSSMKPFIYSAALEKGFTASTLINDAPLVFQFGGRTWRPENYEGRFNGPTRLREALIHSVNIVSIRLLHAIGIGYAIDYLTRFGLPRERLPHNLSLALGSGTATPLEMAGAYATFANTGFRIEPYFIDRIDSPNGERLFQADPPVACPQCNTEVSDGAAARPYAINATAPVTTLTRTATGQRIAPRVIRPQNTFIMTSLLRDVIQRGTGRRALALGRGDLSGKTGTTNDQRDAWFCGFNPDIVTVAWVGFDKLDPLGHAETGGRAALPAWMAYMAEALKDTPERLLEQPTGIVTMRINPETGAPADSYDPDAMFEIFMADALPTAPPESLDAGTYMPATAMEMPEQLF
jgi:penicillin-binding protein 1A